ncbi:MAG: peptide ABC transporter substrate-binding protein [Alphaproteobacteria bacterium]
MTAWSPRRARGLAGIALGLAIGLAASSAEAEMVLNRGNGAEPETLDIHKMIGVPEAHIAKDLFEGLVATSADGSLIPGVAESWTIADDGLSYTFKLRADAKWSNGEALTAEDVVYGIRRCLDPATASEYAYLLYPIKNAEEFNGGTVTDAAEVGVEAVDPQTVRFTLRGPTPYFLSILTWGQASPAPKAVVDAHGDQWTKPGNLVGNGAYMLAEWVPQDHVTLVKNPYFHDAANVMVDKVVFYPTEDIPAELQRYRAGELDTTYEVPSDQIGWIKENLPDEFRNSAYLGVYYYAFNLTQPPFKDNPALRQALALAVDRATLTDKITQAGEFPAYSWIPPGVLDYTSQPLDWAQTSQDERNAMAQKLYTEAGYSADNPLEVEILYNTSDNHKKVAIAIAGMWQQVLGVKATLKNEEWKAFLATRSEKQFQITRAGWIGDYNDANTFLDLFLSDVGPINDPGYASAKYDELVKGASVEKDPAKRRAMLEEAERVFLADLPAIPIYHYTTKHMVKPYVTGWVDNILDYHPTRWVSVSR